jgi:hypothetical protein
VYWAKAVVEDLLQLPFKVLHIEVFAHIDCVSRLADRLDDELRSDSLGLLREHKDSRKIQETLIGGEVHVLQQSQPLFLGVGEMLLVDIEQEVGGP